MFFPNMMPILIDIEDDMDEEERIQNPKDIDKGKDNYDFGKDKFDKFNQVDRILNKIEKNNPEIFTLLKMYNMPYPVARRLVRRIIRLTLNYQ